MGVDKNTLVLEYCRPETGAYDDNQRHRGLGIITELYDNLSSLPGMDYFTLNTIPGRLGGVQGPEGYFVTVEFEGAGFLRVVETVKQFSYHKTPCMGKETRGCIARGGEVSSAIAKYPVTRNNAPEEELGNTMDAIDRVFKNTNTPLKGAYDALLEIELQGEIEVVEVKGTINLSVDKGYIPDATTGKLIHPDTLIEKDSDGDVTFSSIAETVGGFI